MMQPTTILAIMSLVMAAISHVDSFFWQAQSNPSSSMMVQQYQPNPQQLWLIQRLMAQQQQQQQQQLSSPIVGSSSTAATTNSRIAELIFGPNKHPKSYSEKLETLSQRIAKSDGLSHDDSMRLRGLNRDLVGRLFDRQEPGASGSRRRNETTRLVSLIRRIVDERIEFYLNNSNETRNRNDAEDESYANNNEETTSGESVFINQVETRRKEARPRKYVRFVDADDDTTTDSVDGYYAERISSGDGVEKLAYSSSSSSNDLNARQEEEEEEEKDLEVERARVREEERRREMKRWRKQDEKERKRAAKEEMRIREEYHHENVRPFNNNHNLYANHHHYHHQQNHHRNM